MMTRFDPTIFDELRAYALRATVLIPMARDGAGTKPAPSSDLFAKFVRAVRAITGRLSEHSRAIAGTLPQHPGRSRDRMIDTAQL